MHTFQIQGLSSELRVMRFSGNEGLSQLFHFEIVVACAENDIAFTSALGMPAVLTFHVGDQPRHAHGIVSTFEQGEDGKKLTAYHVTLVPNVWRLQHRRDSRIFQELTTPDILKKVLAKAGISDYKLQLSGSYSPREYCVQYRESDWSFMCRLMEEEGIYYFFEHTEDKDVLVLGDTPSAHEPISGAATLPFRAPLGALVKTEHVSRFRYSERVRPGKVTLRDYNFKKPSLSLESSKSGSDDTDLEIYDYPGDYDAPAGGSAFAKVRLEMLQARKKTADGDSACPRFTPGHKFTLADHAREDFNQEYLITRVDHQGFEPRMDAPMGDETPPYKNTFEVIPASVPFRPPQVTPWPAIKGIQTAIVVGPGGEEIHTDEHGRIKVQFHWDREGKKDDQASCWIRVSQVWAGGAWGAMFIPRIGHEVVVDFLEGDPDRPLVVGSVYHGTNVPPYPLPASKTKSTIKSNSSKGGGGSNEFRFEDKKGSEEIYLHGQKDYNIKIEHDKNQVIGHDETKKVGHDETHEVDHDRKKTIKHDQFEAVHHDDTIDIGANRRETIGGNESVTIGGNAVRAVAVSQTEGVGATYTLSVGGAMSQSVGGVLNFNVGGAKVENVGVSASQTVGGNVSLTAGRDYTLSVGSSLNTTVTKDHAETADANRTMTVAKKLTITVGESVVTLEKDGKITVSGKDITVQGEGTIHVQGKSKVIVKSDGPVQVEAAGEVKVKGSAVKIELKVGGAMAIIPDIVLSHASEAAFSWARRDAAVRAHHHNLDSLCDLDEAIEAHVDGLRVAGNPGWAICRGEVEQGDGGACFVATVLATERADIDGISLVLDTGGDSPLLSRGIASGLGWVARSHVEALLPGFLAEGGPAPLQWLGIAACAAHRMDPGPALIDAIESSDERLAARAVRAAGELGRTDLRRKLREALRSEHEAVRFAAAWSLSLLGDEQGAPVLFEFASSESPFAEKAVLLASRAADTQARREWIERHATDPETQRTAVIGAGASGDPHFVPWLLHSMQSPELARVAGASFSLITGVDLRKERAVAPPPEGASFGPNDDPDDDDVALDRDEHLPWPAPSKAAEIWHRIHRGFVSGQRYLLGQLVSQTGAVHRVLAQGTQTERAAAALEIALGAPGRPLFEVRAPGFQQREMLGVAA